LDLGGKEQVWVAVRLRYEHLSQTPGFGWRKGGLNNVRQKTMKEANPVSRMHTTSWQVIETMLWGFALFMVVPPVPSFAGPKYSPVPALLIGGAAFVAHIGIKVMRNEESVVFGILKTAVYLSLVLVVNMRVFMS
jgi:hypothetical protein